MYSNKPRRFGATKPSFGRGRPTTGRRFPSRSRFADKKIDVSRYINKNAVVEERVKYVPTNTFSDFALEEILMQNIVKKGYAEPTPIQDQAIPVVLKGEDIVGIADTGTGKTAAFLVPLIQKAMLGKGEQIVIVVPTRELATQINDELKALAANTKMHSVVVVGGTPMGPQISHLRYFNNFVIGTPGRMKDLIERGVLNLSTFKTVVLDEADRMLDMGFVHDMRLMMSKMPKERQTLFFSATISPEIERLIKDFLKDPVRISVKTGATSKNVHQDVINVSPGENKISILLDLLSKEEFDKVLVFGRTKHGVQKLSDALSEKGFSSTAIHGNKNQAQRQRALDDFKTNKTRVLVATDVAARGLDIPNVSHVINFDVPATHEDYTHRIGRTGRGGNLGKAITFVD